MLSEHRCWETEKTCASRVRKPSDDHTTSMRMVDTLRVKLSGRLMSRMEGVVRELKTRLQ